ncbi:MAG TPA: DUF1670 domain-containing protein, partial [Sedimentisphaerales bacterium]|nr:DUF1670 domain-containing protein [Sedimentisphaerales bacterium]
MTGLLLPAKHNGAFMPMPLLVDLSEILNIADSLVAQLLSKYERQNKTLIPRRGTIHDAGNSLSHKRIICHKRYVEGK